MPALTFLILHKEKVMNIKQVITHAILVSAAAAMSSAAVASTPETPKSRVRLREGRCGDWLNPCCHGGFNS